MKKGKEGKEDKCKEIRKKQGISPPHPQGSLLRKTPLTFSRNLMET